MSDAATMDAIFHGKYQLVFFTPEMIISKKHWRRLLGGDVYANRLKALIIDEAHCVKKWGETFRQMLLRIREVRSLIPTSVHVMALTATATRSDISFISRIVGLRNPFVITRVPVIPNLIYAVGLFKSIPETFQNLAQKLDYLGAAFTNPDDAPDLPEFRLVDMFTSVTDPAHKSEIIRLFKGDGNLRIVVATMEFGMGVDCPNIR
ncbi:ATP-dependent DNA helicase RecQ-like [Halichondria panicea]|uniref:ATP-dependent DNA helicase RecQ-like n=1 Tax=Halichondria panicea TaxID=6063 RepID=UPI00312BBDA0